MLVTTYNYPIFLKSSSFQSRKNYVTPIKLHVHKIMSLSTKVNIRWIEIIKKEGTPPNNLLFEPNVL
jgi:hypothetical protein